MPGLTPILPIVFDSEDGIMTIKTPRGLIVQNLKNILLTSPGERIMDPEFGAGIRKYLFEPSHVTTYMDIETRIRNQVRKYLPFIKILGITFSTSPDMPGASVRGRKSDVLDGHFLGIKIAFKIIPLGITQILSLP